jgi:putative tricarboxylic transport membrane protein
MLVVLNLPLIGLWVRLLTIPRPWLYAGILLFATLGTIGVNSLFGRTRDAAGFRPARLWAPAVRLSNRPCRHRPHSRPHGGAATAPRPRDQPGDPTVLVGSPLAIILLLLALAASSCL